MRRRGEKTQLIISVDDDSDGGYHNKGGKDQTWYDVLIM